MAKRDFPPITPGEVLLEESWQTGDYSRHSPAPRALFWHHGTVLGQHAGHLRSRSGTK